MLKKEKNLRGLKITINGNMVKEYKVNKIHCPRSDVGRYRDNILYFRPKVNGFK